MKRILRSRLPPALTSEQVESLTEQSQLPEEDIQDWYERFTHCYPRGYLSRDEFLGYFKRFHNSQPNGEKPNRSADKMIKQLFQLLDINHDKHLNFDEFFLFHLLINQGSMEDKLRVILRLYDSKKTKQFTRPQLESVLSNMFEILSIPKPVNGLGQSIETILKRTNIEEQESKISWSSFSTCVLEDRSLLNLLLTGRERSRGSPSIITTRF